MSLAIAQYTPWEKIPSEVMRRFLGLSPVSQEEVLEGLFCGDLFRSLVEARARKSTQDPKGEYSYDAGVILGENYVTEEKYGDYRAHQLSTLEHGMFKVLLGFRPEYSDGLERIKDTMRYEGDWIRVDAGTGQALLEQKGQVILHQLGVSRVEFSGTVVKDVPSGQLFTVCAVKDGNHFRRHPSPLSARIDTRRTPMLLIPASLLK